MDWIRIGFEGLNLVIMPLWFGLLFFPTKRWVPKAIDIFLFVAAILFTVNLLPGVREAFPIILKPTLENVGAMLSQPAGTLGSWTHFVMADLWVGRFITQDARAHGISRWFTTPILVLTLLFGPVGLLAYLVVKLGLKKQFGTQA